MPYTVLLIGLGNIGMLYDAPLAASEYVQSHARAFTLHPNFSLVGAVDLAPTLRELFIKRYRVPAVSKLSELCLEVSPDVVVIATPTATHFSVIKEILQFCRPKQILCEKPLAYSIDDAQAIVEQCHERGVQLFVNYIRRADPGVLTIKSRIDSGLIYLPYKTVVWYSKGLLHNGSHFLDLLTYWFGTAKTLEVIDPGRRINEYDAEPDCYIRFESGAAIFCAAREENFSHYTIEIIAANGRLRYEQGGAIEWKASGPHPTLDRYFQLQAEVEVIKNDMNRYQYNVADQLCRALDGGAHSLCTGVIGAMNIKLLTSLINQRVEH